MKIGKNTSFLKVTGNVFADKQMADEFAGENNNKNLVFRQNFAEIQSYK